MGMTIQQERPRAVRASAPESAKLLKKTLRAAFPAVTFSVKLSRGTGYGYCDVSWTDGPTRQRVEAVVAPFEGSHFDGMQDLEEHVDSFMPDGRLTGLRGIHCNRQISAGFARRIAAAVAEWWGGEDMRAPEIIENGRWWSIQDAAADRAARVRTGEDWHTLIYRASCDQSSVAQEVAR